MNKYYLRLSDTNQGLELPIEMNWDFLGKQDSIENYELTVIEEIIVEPEIITVVEEVIPEPKIVVVEEIINNTPKRKSHPKNWKG